MTKKKQQPAVNVPPLSEVALTDPRCIAYIEASRPYAEIPKKAYHQLSYRLRLMKQSQISEFTPPKNKTKPENEDGGTTD